MIIEEDYEDVEDGVLDHEQPEELEDEGEEDEEVSYKLTLLIPRSQ